MSKILEELLGTGNNPALSQLQKQFDLSEKDTRVAVEELIPALQRGLQNNTREAPGMDDLLDALRTGEHSKYMEQPGSLGNSTTTKEGNDILGHILGNKDVSREVAKRASNKSGISSTILKKMLPIVATMVMGTLSKKVIGGNRSAVNRNSSGGLLTSLLDSDNDGSVWDDVLGMAAKSMLR